MIIDSIRRRSTSASISHSNPVSHLATLEGAVTIVEDVPFEDRPRASFLADFGTNAIERRYLPVVVLAYHAFLVLLNLTQEGRAWINLRAPSSKDARRLRKLREDILEFRLFHHLTYVSVLTMLNEFHRRLTWALGLERMLPIADRDVAEIGIWLDARLKEAETPAFGLVPPPDRSFFGDHQRGDPGRILLETVPWLKTVSWLSEPLGGSAVSLRGWASDAKWSRPACRVIACNCVRGLRLLVVGGRRGRKARARTS